MGIFSSPERQEMLRHESQRLRGLLARPREEEVLTLLGKLILHYPMANMTTQEKTLLLEDYVDDLSDYPAWAIQEACRTYRRDPDNKFFPKVAVLIDLAKSLCSRHKRMISHIALILDQADRDASKQSSPVTALAKQFTSSTKPKES